LGPWTAPKASTDESPLTAACLQRFHHLTVARSTVHRILIRYGMNRLPANQKRRPTEMIPMRDGVKPYTVIILPRGAKDAPIVLTRTPTNARRPLSNTDPSMEALLPEADTEFVRVRIRNTRPK